MRAHGLDPGFAEHRVVGVPAEDLVGEDVEVLVDAEAPLGEELVECDTVRPVRLAREQVSLHRRRQPPGCLTVRR